MVGVRATKGKVRQLGGSARRNTSPDKPKEMGSGEEEGKRPVTTAHTQIEKRGEPESDD